jgi:NADH-quinone oxidoreductase subunit M
MMALLVAMLGVFVARDVLLFYIFFELTLIPMFFIIGIWGGPERRYAAGKFFLFTFTGSVFTLAAAIYLGLKYGTFDIPGIIQGVQGGYNGVAALSSTERFWVVMGFLSGFAVKVPLFPVHTWLPLAHTEAPTAGSVILAGVLLKLGTYGLFRLAVPIGLVAANGSVAYPTLVWWLGLLCVIGIIYGALVAWVQQDIKKLVAYSSVSHLGFCVIGLIALNDIGLQGSVLYMINHGINTGALFLCVGMIYDRYHTRDINQLSGLARRMPVLAFFFVLFSLASIGLPGTNGFISEFLTTLGAFISPHLGWAFGSLAALGVILGAVYILHMVGRIIWGPLKTPAVHDAAVGHTAHGTAVGQEDRGQAAGAAHGHGHGHGHGRDDHGAPGDIGRREIAILVPLAVAVIVLGVKPGLVMDSMLRPAQGVRTFAAQQVIVPRVPTTGPSLLPATMPVANGTNAAHWAATAVAPATQPAAAGTDGPIAQSEIRNPKSEIEIPGPNKVR